jgi:hypothetical protein
MSAMVKLDKRVVEALHRPFALYGLKGLFSPWGNFCRTGIAANPAAEILPAPPNGDIDSRD